MNFLKSLMADFSISIPPVVDLITGSTMIGMFIISLKICHVVF